MWRRRIFQGAILSSDRGVLAYKKTVILRGVTGELYVGDTRFVHHGGVFAMHLLLRDLVVLREGGLDKASIVWGGGAAFHQIPICCKLTGSPWKKKPR